MSVNSDQVQNIPANIRDTLGSLSAWLMVVSAVIYFLCSYGVKNHFHSLVRAFEKTLVRM